MGKFAGYHQIESLKLNLKENETIRADIPRKSNLDVMGLINLDTDYVFDGTMNEIVKWVKKILSEGEDEEIRIKSSGK